MPDIDNQPPHREQLDLYVLVILVIGNRLQTTGTGPHVGFTWNGKYMVNAYIWNVIYMVKWGIWYTYYCCRCCCCILIQLTNALTNFAIAPAQMNKFCNISICVPLNPWKCSNPHLQYFENGIFLLLTWVLNQECMSPEAGASSSRPFEHTSVDESSIHNTLK